MAFDIQALDHALAERIAKRNLPGVSVGIRGPEGVVFEKGYGFGDQFQRL
jgi:predicted extracellular nuclease